MGATEYLQRSARNAWYCWGHFVGRKPKTVIVGALALALLCCLRLFLIPAVGPLPSELRQEYLFAPQDSEGFKDMLRYDDTWGPGARPSFVYFTTKTEGGNVLTKDVLGEVGRFDALVNQISAISYTDGGDETNFGVSFLRKDLCHPSSSRPSCTRIQDPLELFLNSTTGTYDFDHTDAEIASYVQNGRGIDGSLFPPGRTIATSMMFGGQSYDEDGVLIKAKAVRLTYYMAGTESDSDLDFATNAWEEELNYLVGPRWTSDPPISKGAATNGSLTWSSELVAAYPETSGAVSRELSANIMGDVVLFIIGIFVLIAYTVFVLLSPKNCLGSRGMLLCAGLTSTGLAIAMSFGLATLFVENNVVVNVLPFVLIGIGVDDMFVLVHALSEVPADVDVPERIGRAMGHAGASITVTSLTDMIAFALGASSVLPGLSGFCVFAVFGILGDFLMQVSFFAGFMVLDARREQNGKHDCFCCNPCKASLPRVCKTYPTLQELDKRFYVPLLRKPAIKAVVLVVFFGFSGAMAWCASNLKQDFNREWFVNTDAVLYEAFDVRDEHFKTTGGPPVYLITPPLASFDYVGVAGQKQLLALGAAVGGNKWILNNSYTGWYAPLRRWVHADGTKSLVLADGTTVAGAGTSLDDCYLPSEHFFDYLAEYLRDDPYARSIAANFKWVSAACDVGAAGSCGAAEAGKGLLATKMRADYIEVPDSDNKVDSMRDLRDDIDDVAGDTYAYTFAFVFYEQYAIIIQEAMLNLGLAALATFFLVLLTVSQLRAAMYVLLCVVMVDIDILGLMWLWDLTIDSVTIINLVLAIGLVVDYSAHIAHAFVIAKGTKQQRADEAIGNMGSAVFHGAMSTFAAVVVLGGSSSYIYKVFFKQFFGICVFGAAHGIVFLPVLLSLVGPPEINVVDPDKDPSSTKPASKETSATNDEEAGKPRGVKDTETNVTATPSSDAVLQTA